MTMLQNSNRRFSARKDVLGTNKGTKSVNKGVLAPVFAPNITTYCARDGCEKGAASADKASFGANKVLALKFFFSAFTVNCLLVI